MQELINLMHSHSDNFRSLYFDSIDHTLATAGIGRILHFTDSHYSNGATLSFDVLVNTLDSSTFIYRCLSESLFQTFVPPIPTAHTVPFSHIRGHLARKLI